jgi:acetyl esterase/lipase
LFVRHRYRQCTNVAQIRASFEGVPRHPVLQWLAALRRPALGVFRRRVLIPRRSVIHGVDATDDENIECFIYYRGRPEELPNCTRVVLQFHGGGFVAMNPQCHEDYMCKIAKQLDAVLVCVNYRKAPEHPYPAGLNDCFDVYETLRDDNGRCVGITPTSFSNGLEQPLTIVLMGDSAGGNLAAAVCLRVLLINEHATSEEEYLREPDGVR